VGGRVSDFIGISVVVLTFGRDSILPNTLAALTQAMGGRKDVELVLVDNNADGIDRTAFLAGFPHGKLVRTGVNKGVSARNDGMDVARGEVLVLLDDDVLVRTEGFLDLFEAAFRDHPEVGAVNVRKLDSLTNTVLPETIPHTRKDMDIERPFFTFRFVGGLVALRRQVHLELGGFDRSLFYGEEEREYSYRMLKAGWRMYYEPAITAVETNHAGGRRSRVSLRTEILSNRYIISYLHRPTLVMLFDFVVFTSFLFVLERGRLGVPQAVARFLRWLVTPGRPPRRPIGPKERAYIRACGGTIWR
jgi:GT2 family glycosyltransferase